MFILGDDGTSDVIIFCPDCDEEQRYNYQFHEDENEYLNDQREEVGPSEDELTRLYNEFVASIIEDANDEHECMPGYEGKE